MSTRVLSIMVLAVTAAAWARVSVLYMAWGQTHDETLSDDEGAFEFGALSPAGKYRLSCAAEGSREQVLNVTVEGTTRVELRMHAQ